MPEKGDRNVIPDYRTQELKPEPQDKAERPGKTCSRCLGLGEIIKAGIPQTCPSCGGEGVRYV